MARKEAPIEHSLPLMAWGLPEPCALCGQSIQVGTYYGIFVRSRGGVPGRIMLLCPDCNCRMREILGENAIVEFDKAKEERDGDDD